MGSKGEVQGSERFELRTYSETKKDKAETESEIGEPMMMKKRDGCSSSRAEAEDEEERWERALHRKMLRVMLVEADDSTRQIIVALLRKCSYNVVAIPDGLKAWEILKGKPHDIDLILTEVHLPSISGFALLTLIMEHEICKSIPVIMMSSQDSISTVYKCMMRGAADYLVKPIRRNELINMWQHVWRRRQSSTENSLIEQSISEEKIEGTSENHVGSSNSNGYMPCNQGTKEQLHMGNDAQSSCTKQDLEVNHIHVEDMQESSSDMGMQKHKVCINFDILHGNEARVRCREIPRFGYGTVRIQASNVSIGSGGYDERNENGSEQNFSNDSFRSNTPSEISDIKKPPTEIPYPLLIALVLFGCGMVFSLIAFTKEGPSSILAAIAKSGFTAAFMLIFVSEIRDKTFFIAALLAMQYKKALVLLGSMGALSLMTILSVVIGRIFHSVPAQFHTTLPIGEYAAVTLLLIFGIKSIKDAWDLPSGYEGGTLGNADAEITLESYIKEEGHKTDVNMTSEGCDNNDVIVNHTRNSADLLGAFNSHPICCNRKFSLSNGANKFDSTPHLDLSLRGSSSSRFENRVIEKRTTLGNSNASAFTQYINRSLLPSSTTENACDQEKECRGNDEKHIADVVSGYNYNYGTLASALNMQKGTTTLASDQSYHSKIVLSCSQQEEFPIPVPLSFHMGFGTILPPIFPSQSVEYNKSEQLYKPCCQKANVIRDQTVQKKEQKLGCIEDQTNISSATDRSGCSSSSLCNGTGSHINSMGGFGSACVSSSNIDQVAIGQFDSVNKNQENFIAQDGNSHWSVQREAALRKFRMKRKDRCFEKKVRYESRKKLADQRPRVKGQFVRRQGHVSAFLVANRW